MTREEKERIQQKLHRAADAHLNAYGGNLYYEGVARGLEQAAGIVGKTKCVDVVEVVRCKDCIYGEQDDIGRWYCRSLGCQVGDEDGSGFCADGERREDERSN